MDFHPLGDHFQLPSCGSQPCAADQLLPGRQAQVPHPPVHHPHPQVSQPPTLSAGKWAPSPPPTAPLLTWGQSVLTIARSLTAPFPTTPHQTHQGGPADSSFRSHPRTPALSPPGRHPSALAADWLHCSPPHSPPDRLIFTVPPHSGRWDALIR